MPLFYFLCQSSFNSICTCQFETETTTHNQLHCPIYPNETIVLLDKIRNINVSILEQNYTIITKDLLFGNISLDDASNTLIFNATIDSYINN